MNISACLSSKDHTWRTPYALFRALDEEFNFTIDVAATEESALCTRYYGPRDNALWQKWDGVVWCNPPYGRTLGDWVRKAYLASTEGATVVLLVPARTDVAWFHDFALKGEIRFIRGRLRFGGSTTGAPFPSILIIFRPRAQEMVSALEMTA